MLLLCCCCCSNCCCCSWPPLLVLLFVCCGVFQGVGAPRLWCCCPSGFLCAFLWLCFLFFSGCCLLSWRPPCVLWCCSGTQLLWLPPCSTHPRQLCCCGLCWLRCCWAINSQKPKFYMTADGPSLWPLGCAAQSARFFFCRAFCVRFCLCFLFFSGCCCCCCGLLCGCCGVVVVLLLLCCCGVCCGVLCHFVWVVVVASGCWAPCCSFFRRAFCVRFCLCFLLFSGFFVVPALALVLGAPCCCFVPSGLLCALLFVFSLLFGLLLLLLLLWCCCGVVVCVVQNCWWVSSRFLGLSPAPPPLAGPPFTWRPKISLFFFLSPAGNFILSSLCFLWGGGGLLVELWPRFKAMAHPKCGFRLVGAPAAVRPPTLLGRRAASFRSGFSCAFLVFSLLFGLFLGSWPPPLGPHPSGRPAETPSPMTALTGCFTGAGKAYDSVGGLFCVRFCLCFLFFSGCCCCGGCCCGVVGGCCGGCCGVVVSRSFLWKWFFHFLIFGPFFVVFLFFFSFVLWPSTSVKLLWKRFFHFLIFGPFFCCF